MIPRYSRPEMSTIWETENRFKIMLEVEMLICEAQEEIGLIPAGTTKKIRHKAKFDIKRVDEIEKQVKHDVIAFLTNVAAWSRRRICRRGCTFHPPGCDIV